MNDIEDIDEFIDSELNIVKVLTLEIEKKLDILKSEYLHESQQITYFLSTLKKLKNVSASDYFRFCKKAMRFLVQESHLFCHQRRNVLLIQIIDFKDQQRSIMRSLHKLSDHRKCEKMYKKMT